MPEMMQAMRLHRAGEPLRLERVPVPEPRSGEVLLRVAACGACRTDLRLVDGELTAARLPVIPGHQIVGEVVALGTGVEGIATGERVGVPWLGWTCGVCARCAAGEENLCESARFTGYQIDGGFAEFARADSRYCFPLDPNYPAAQVAPLLCAGLIGWRSLVMAGDGERIGFYGFGAAAHILIQVARYQGREIYAFTRAGDVAGQDFARQLGAVWAGDAEQEAPVALDAAIVFAPVGGLVPTALRAVRPGGRVVCAGIHMSEIPSFPYAILWGERSVVSVANLTRRDGKTFLALAPQVPVTTRVTTFELAQANEALAAIRQGTVDGAVVVRVGDG